MTWPEVIATVESFRPLPAVDNALVHVAKWQAQELERPPERVSLEGDTIIFGWDFPPPCYYEAVL